jgi:hypothetical protein
MSLRQISPDAVLQLLETPSLGRTVGKERRMHVSRREPMASANNDKIAIGIPLEDRPGREAESPPNFGGD